MAILVLFLHLQRRLAQISAAGAAASHDRNTPLPGTVSGSRQSQATHSLTCPPSRDATSRVVVRYWRG